MEAHLNLTGIAIVALAATLFGIASVRFRQPAIIGYILAGSILGPGGLGLVQNRESITVLAELGVILLLYFVGMELSLRSFRAIWKISIITASGQIIFAILVCILAGHVFGWKTTTSLLFGFCLAISSTAVAIKVLENMKSLRTDLGRTAIGILVAQDLAVAPMLLLVSSMKDGAISWLAPVEMIFSIAVLIGVITFMTKRAKVNMPFHHIWAEREDLAPLGALTWCFVVAGLAGFLGLSVAFGAFLAGLIVGNSAQRSQVFNGAGPIQTVLLMVFFLSIGMLVDFVFIWNNLGVVIFFWFFVLCFKTALNVLLLRLQRQSWSQSFKVGLVLGQLGEFSFVLAGAALVAGVLDPDTHQMLVAVTVLSLATSPFLTSVARRLQHRSFRNVKNLRSSLRLIYSRELRVSKRFSNFTLKLIHMILKQLGKWIDVLNERANAIEMRIKHANTDEIAKDQTTDDPQKTNQDLSVRDPAPQDQSLPKSDPVSIEETESTPKPAPKPAPKVEPMRDQAPKPATKPAPKPAPAPIFTIKIK
ncbi:MAG: cation:proton antiporter [Pseudomonadota bacterium]